MIALWPYGDHTCWDQGFVDRLIAGELWPGSLVFQRARPDLPWGQAYENGAVVVLHGEVTSRDGYVDAVRNLVESLPWAVVIQTSDERLTFDAMQLAGPRVKVWKQMVQRDTRCDRALLLGWRAETRDVLARVGRLPVGERPILWSFAGQAQNARRRACHSVLEGRGDGDLLVTGGFGQGRDLEGHLRTMASSAVVLCPTGNTVDCQRPYEAMEAGCLPIGDRRSSDRPPSWPPGDGGYWRHVLGHEPFPCVDDWGELPGLLDTYAQDPVKLQRDANRAGAWWHGYKRRVALELADDVLALGGPSMPRCPVTVLMPTSSIPTHPSTELIEDSIRRTRAYPELRDAEIIVMVDGLAPQHDEPARRAAYEEYKRRLIALCQWDPEFRGVLPLIFDEHTHQAGMTREALRLVRTSLILFQEHDTWPCWDIDWGGLFLALKEPGVNQIQLHTEDHVLDEHRYLMMDPGPRDVAGVPLIRHRKWSQRPHLARADWYRWMLAEFFGARAKTMIEDVMWGVISTQVGENPLAWDRFGTWIYHPHDERHGVLRSKTNDGRGGEAKVPLLIAYDGDTPVGAPRPGRMEW